MFDKLEDLLIRFDELLNMLNDPSVIGDPQRFQKLMKEQSSLQPIVDTYKEYKSCRQTVEESLSMLEEESDERCVICSRKSLQMHAAALRSLSRS